MKLLWILFSVEGRIGRLAYFGACVVALSSASFGQSFVLRLAGLPEAYVRVEELQALRDAPFVASTVFAIHSLASWIGFAAGAKRLHDVGRSASIQIFALLALILAVFSLVGALIEDVEWCVYVAWAGVFSASLYASWVLLQLAFRRGGAAANRYGAPPAPLIKSYSNP
jgi:uncharacterized membrane protein YhaH (DUF805 family)